MVVSRLRMSRKPPDQLSLPPEKTLSVKEVKDRLWNRAVKNIDNESFIPMKSIKEVLNKDVITLLLDYSGAGRGNSDPRFVQNLATDIINFALVTFAVLIDIEQCTLIPKFVGRPHTLPVTKDYLTSIDLNERQVNLFYPAQYRFLEAFVPFGTVLPKQLDNLHILPFVPSGQSMLTIEGAFGKVTEFRIWDHPNTGGEIFIRKQFICDPKNHPNDYIAELHNLTILIAADHPNIIPLLAAYNHRSTQNLVFPFAAGGNLADILSGTKQISYLNRSESSTEEAPGLAVDFLVGIAGLFSAVSCMHHRLDTNTLHSIGCHRDLKPSNILVIGQRLLLADFGLARIVGEESTSQSIQPTNQGDYIAPECQDMYDPELLFKKGGRASDMWSLGGIILNILVLRHSGATGVHNFWKSRELLINGVRRRRFHVQDKPNEAVTKYLQHLECSSEPTIVYNALVPMARAMLSIEPKARPTADVVAKHTQRAALFQQSQIIWDQFNHIFITKTSAPHIYVEFMKFRGWMVANELPTPAPLAWPPPENIAEMPIRQFELVVNQLKRQSDALSTQEDINRSIRLQALRQEIDLLLRELPTNKQAVARDFTERSLLDRSNSKTLLSIETYSEACGSDHLRNMAILKRHGQQPAEAHGNKSSVAAIHYDKAFGWKPLFGQFYQIHMHDDEATDNTPLLAEVRNPAKSESTEVFFDRVGRLAKMGLLLNRAESIPSLHVLAPFGPGFYCHEIYRYSGLVYQYPSGTRGSLRSSVTLKAILSRSTPLRPHLGERFSLAWALANSLYELHKASWLHRRVSAANVVYFRTEDDEDSTVDIDHFYFVGFAQSRPDEDLADTDGYVTDPENEYYLHPRYRNSDDDFQAGFDYYALGILLLEIGSGKLLPELCRTLGQDLNNVCKHDCIDLLEELAYVCGSQYSRAIEACVRLDIMKEGESFLKGPKIETKFRSLVLSRLLKCKDAGY